jgi:hypothetical protein
MYRVKTVEATEHWFNGYDGFPPSHTEMRETPVSMKGGGTNPSKPSKPEISTIDDPQHPDAWR